MRVTSAERGREWVVAYVADHTAIIAQATERVTSSVATAIFPSPNRTCMCPRNCDTLTLRTNVRVCDLCVVDDKAENQGVHLRP